MTTIPIDERVAEYITVSGVVQGVGFRPFVYRLAREHALVGHVGNDSTRVFIEVCGPGDEVEAFARLCRGGPAAGCHRARRAPARHAVDDRRVRDRRESIRDRRAHARVTGHRGVRRLSRRTPQPERSPIPAPVHHLHELWTTVHDHPKFAVRPTRHHDGVVPDVSAVQHRVHRSGRPSLPRPTDLLPTTADRC